MPPNKDLLVSIGAKAFAKRKKVSATDDSEYNDLELGSEKGYIYEVPKNIRQGNEKAYTPLLISIGPLHYRKKNLANMNKHKLRYQDKFLGRTSKVTLERFWSSIERKETTIRNSYEALITEDEFVLMIFYDALFIVELFLSKYEKEKEKDEGITDYLLNETLSATLRRDLILLENQIPLFVLEKLYELYHNFLREDKSDSASALPFLHHACIYFDIPWDEEFFKDKDIRHFTDLQRCHLVKKHPQVPYEIPSLKRPSQYSATSLNDAGVKLTADENACLLDIKLEGKELKIPKLTVDSNTEAYIRNVMAFEMCHYPSEAYVCAYIELMNCLIKTAQDVDLLTKKGILSKEGKNEGILVSRINPNIMLAAMIKKLMQGVGQPPPACYLEIGNRLNQLENAGLVKKIVNLKRAYFANILRGSATVASLMALLLTFIQTVLAFLK